MSNDKKPPEHLATDQLAPLGWVLYGHARKCLSPRQPYCLANECYYIPVQPEPRVWEGTIEEMHTSICAAWKWDKDTRVRVVEVVES